jgi:DNA/RNA endonuclease YhcR with UshA esterase domain
MKRLILSIAISLCLLPLFAQALTPIANIQDSTTAYNNRTVYVSGTITIGVGKLSTTQCKAYIQDNSGRGIMIFDYTLNNTYNTSFVRGNVVKLSGKVTEYNGVTELTNLSNIEVLDQGAPLPVLNLSIDQASNYQYYEGTYVKVSGSLTENPYVVGGGANITIKDSLNKTIACRVWDSTGINYSTLSAGIPIDAYGVVSPYNNKSQILPAYQQDIVIKLTDPVISNLAFSPASPYVDQSIQISAKVVDYNGSIAYSNLFYKIDGEDNFRTVRMTSGSNNTYSATIPSFNTFMSGEGKFIFYLYAIDNDSVFVSSQQQSITVMKRRPIISNVMFNYDPLISDSLFVQATITDQDGTIQEAKLIYSTNFSHNEKEVNMTLAGANIYQAAISAKASGSVVFVSIWAIDDSMLVSIKDTDNDGNPISFTFPVLTHKAILRIEPKVFNIYNGDKINIGYFGKPGNKAILRIYNVEGKLIKTINKIINSDDEGIVPDNANGIMYEAWNGKDNNDQHVDPGVYICHLEVIDVVTGNKKIAQAPIVIGMKLK